MLLRFFSVLGTKVAQSTQTASDHSEIGDTPTLFSRVENENIVLERHFAYHQRKLVVQNKPKGRKSHHTRSSIGNIF